VSSSRVSSSGSGDDSRTSTVVSSFSSEQRLVNVLVRARVVSLIVDHSDHLLESGDETVGSIRVQVGDTHLQQVFVDRVDREPLGL